MWSAERIAMVSDEASVARGIAYADRGLVKDLAVGEHRITATVQGTEAYQVTLTPRLWDCSCPVGLEGWFCKHCVAVALTAQQQLGATAVGGEAPRVRVDLAALRGAVTGLKARGFLDWRRSNSWAAEKVDVIAELEASAASPGAVPLLQRAAERLTATLLQADDSSGLIGDLTHRVLGAHLQACEAHPPKPVALADWLLTFGLDDQDFWSLDVDAYATALGPDGIEHYRAGLAGRQADSYAVQRARQRLALHDRDVDAVVLLIGGPLGLPVRYQWVAEAMLEMDMPDLALEWVTRGLANTSGHQLAGLYDLATRLEPESALTLRREEHQRLHTTRTYALLRDAAADSWPNLVDEARAALAASDLVRMLLSAGDTIEAWREAHVHRDVIPGSLWRELADAYARIDPAATLPVYRTLIDDVLRTTGKPAYQQAARLLKVLRKASEACDDTMFDAYVNALRDDHRRRPTLLAVLDRAGFTQR